MKKFRNNPQEEALVLPCERWALFVSVWRWDLSSFHLASFRQRSYLEVDLCDCHSWFVFPAKWCSVMPCSCSHLLVGVWAGRVLGNCKWHCCERRRWTSHGHRLFSWVNNVYHKYLGAEWWDQMGSGDWFLKKPLPSLQSTCTILCSHRWDESCISSITSWPLGLASLFILAALIGTWR